MLMHINIILNLEYMLDNTGLSESDCTTEVERYFVIPGQV